MPFPDTLFPPPPQATPNPYQFPVEFVAGDEFIFRYPNGSLYPISDGWTMQLSLRPLDGNTQIDIDSSVDGDFLLTQTPTQTADWPVGKYACQLYALKTDKRVTVFEAFLTVLKNLDAVSATADLRSNARKILEAIELTMLGRAGNDILHSQIDNTAFSRMTPEQLQTAHSYWSAKVRSEELKARAKAGRATGRNVLIRFVRPA